MIVTIRAIGTEEDLDLEVLGEIEIEVDPEIGEVDLEIANVDNFHCPFLNKLFHLNFWNSLLRYKPSFWNF